MPLEALIDPDTGGVIVVKPVGSVWGRCEVNAVMLLEDPALEQELAESGGEHVVYPYAAWEEVEQPIGDTVVKRREMREASLVKVAVNNATAVKRISSKPGILNVVDADSPVSRATIAEVKPRPTPKNEISEIVIPNRPLPEAK